MSVLEAYAIWKDEYPTRKIGKAKFAQLHPPFMLLTSQLSQNVCVCKYHTNFILLLELLLRYDWTLPKYDEFHISCCL